MRRVTAYTGAFAEQRDETQEVQRIRLGSGSRQPAVPQLRQDPCVAARPDGAPRYNILVGLSAHTGGDVRRWAKKNKVELCFTPTYPSWANPIEAHVGPLRLSVARRPALGIRSASSRSPRTRRAASRSRSSSGPVTEGIPIPVLHHRADTTPSACRGTLDTTPEQRKASGHVRKYNSFPITCSARRFTSAPRTALSDLWMAPAHR
ncbi:hypothetical protein SsS58_08199 [Streptomyces scabiei]|uniref:Tc1-like transposase DDE domain-containing protein n=1 Tax=Streptomyces scabiei TaxID=1930 RepID=A0A117EGV3_STRSC|nr:hypothetical protein SsS58_08199 [Streptomyces scabiei]